MIKDTFIVVENEDGKIDCLFPSDEECGNPNFNSIWWVCYWAAKHCAFSDLTNDTVLLVVADGNPLHYCGWQPGMVFEFVDNDCVTVFCEAFPSWDH